MTTITLDIPEQKQSEYQKFLGTLMSEYNLEELEDKLLGIHMTHNDETSHPIISLRNKYESHLS